MICQTVFRCFLFLFWVALCCSLAKRKQTTKKYIKKNRTTEAILLETFNNVIFLLFVKFYVII